MDERVNPIGSDSGDGRDGGRGAACTPRWLCDAIGPVDLDPCWNDRAHVQARHVCDGVEHDGLALAPRVPLAWRVFLNPGYGRGVVLPWVRAYRHTDFVFLLRLDPSTEWYAELMPATRYLWVPSCRVGFDPPPGVSFSSNPYPHACFMRSPPNAGMRALGYAFEVA